MDYNSIIDMVYSYTDDLVNTKEYKRLLELKDEIDTKLKTKINKFKELSLRYSEVSKYVEFRPDIKDLQIELSNCKKELMTNPLVISYKKLESEIQNHLDEFIEKLSKTISRRITNKSFRINNQDEI